MSQLRLFDSDIVIVIVGPVDRMTFTDDGRVLLWHTELVELAPARAAAFDTFTDGDVARFGLLRADGRLFYRGLRIAAVPLRE